MDERGSAAVRETVLGNAEALLADVEARWGDVTRLDPLVVSTGSAGNALRRLSTTSLAGLLIGAVAVALLLPIFTMGKTMSG